MAQQKQFDIDAALKAGYSQTEIEAYMLQNGMIPKISQPQINAPSTVNIGSDTPIPLSDPEQDVADRTPVRMPTTQDAMKEVLAQYSTPLSIGAGILAGGAAGLSGYGAPAAGAAASGASALTDTLINQYVSGQQNHPILGTLGLTPEEGQYENPLVNMGASTLEGFAVNQALGKVAEYPLRFGANTLKNVLKESDVAAKGGRSYLGQTLNFGQRKLAEGRETVLSKLGFTPELLKDRGKGSVVGGLAEYEPTAMQFIEAGSHERPILGMIENIFARRQKAEAIIESNKHILQRAEQETKRLTGHKIPISLTGESNKATLDEIARRMRLHTEVNYDNLITEIVDTMDELAPYQKKLGELKASLSGLKPTDPAVKTITAEINALEKDPIYKELNRNLIGLKQSQNYFKRVAGERGFSVRDFLPDKKTGFHANYATSVADEIVNNKEKLSRFFETGRITIGGKTITSSSPVKDTAGYQFARMLNEAYDPSSKLLNINRLKNTWNEYKVSDMGRMVYNQQTRANYDQLFEILGHITPEQNVRGASRYLTLRLGTGVAALGGGLVSGLLGGNVPGIGTAAMVVGGSIALNQLGKLMTDKNVARMLIAAAKGGPLGVPTAVASRALARALIGQTVTMELQNADGTTTAVNGKVNRDGKFVADLGDTSMFGQDIKLKN